MEHDDSIEREERGIYLMILVAGLPVIGALWFEGRAVDGGNALIVVAVSAAVAGLLAGLKTMLASKLPRARLLTSRRAAGSRRLPR